MSFEEFQSTFIWFNVVYVVIISFNGQLGNETKTSNYIHLLNVQESVKENEGWISMETLLKFKRLADLSKEASAIIEALKKSDAGWL